MAAENFTMPDNTKGFVTLTKRPRPDHPSERQTMSIREDLIGGVGVEDFNYTPADKAPVAVLPNAKILKGEATAVYCTVGTFFVKETPDEVLRLICDARKGVTKTSGWAPEQQ